MTDFRDATQLLLDTGAQLKDVKYTEINGRYYTNQNLKEVSKKEYASPIHATTLSALISYLVNCGREIKTGVMIRIVDPCTVQLVSALDESRKREALFECNAIIPNHRFGQWSDQEDFMIYLASCFVPSADQETILKYAGTVEAKTVSTYGDDGISQSATVSTGIASKANVILPSKVSLFPYRTFIEIEQPESCFVFRMDERPCFKLIEADGGVWRIKAMMEIEEYLARELSTASIDIPILR